MIKREQIEPLCMLGYTQERIAREIGRPRADVNYYITKYGLSTGRKASNRKVQNEAERSLLLEMVSKGLNNTEIGKRLGINRDTVRTYLNIYDIKRKSHVPHPNLKANFFESIDTKEKAYWLGFLYADGYVRADGCATVLDLSDKDIRWIEKFCDIVGVCRDRIVHRTHSTGYQSVSIRIQNREFTTHLISQGCTNAKSKTIRLPSFNTNELDMAFLMGYYDGDGSADSTTICSGSIKFLNDIIDRYRLKFRVYHGKSVCTLSLGADLKRQLIRNYPDGMPRKQGMHRRDKRYKLNGTSPYANMPRKFNIDKDELERLIAQHTYVEIGKQFGVCDNSIKKRARLLGIELKGRKRGPKKNNHD